MSIKATLASGAPPPGPEFEGNLIEGLVRSVETAEERAVGVSPPSARGPLSIREAPEPRDFFYATITKLTLPCANVDCHNPARLIIHSKDGETLPYCIACSHVEWSHWMVGA